MANSANPEINKKIATSALGTLFIATVFFYLGDRYAETLVTYPGQIFDHLGDAMLTMWQTIKDAPFALDMTSNSLLFGGACFLIIWMIWLRYVAFIGNYRSGEESGSARWGTVKEGKKFKDLQTEDNNLLFTKNFGLALHRPKFDPEYDRNLNVLVVGGSGSGKTFNYVTPNICQLNTSYFVTDPKGTLLKDAGYLFTDNGYKVIAAICGLALVALIGGGAYYGIGHQTDADSKAESVQANDSKESVSDASAKDGSKSKEKSHTHDWSITYKTVHHDAVTHTEHVAPVYQNLTTYHTVCNECKQVIDGKADDHIKQTGHSGYSTNVPITDEVMVSEGYDKQVTDTPAYDETVIDKLVCTTCGATKDAPQATSDAAK